MDHDDVHLSSTRNAFVSFDERIEVGAIVIVLTLSSVKAVGERSQSEEMRKFTDVGFRARSCFEPLGGRSARPLRHKEPRSVRRFFSACRNLVKASKPPQPPPSSNPLHPPPDKFLQIPLRRWRPNPPPRLLHPRPPTLPPNLPPNLPNLPLLLHSPPNKQKNEM